MGIAIPLHAVRNLPDRKKLMNKRTVALSILCALSFQGILHAQRVKGSDTLLPLTQELAEQYLKKEPDAEVIVTGGGSGVGIAALPENTTDIAMASRQIGCGREPVESGGTSYQGAARSHIQGQDHQLERCRGRGPEDSGLFPRDFIRHIRVLQGKRPGEQELYEQHPLDACHRRHHPVCQTDQRGDRVYRLPQAPSSSLSDRPKGR